MCSTLSCALQKHSRLGHTIVLASLMIPLVALHDLATLTNQSQFRIYNNSHLKLTHLYISNSEQGFWTQNVLQQNGLSSGESIQVPLDTSLSNQCLYDIHAVFANQQAVEDYQVNLCSQSEYTFSH